MASSATVWNFVRTALEADDSTSIIDGRLVVTEKVPFGVPTRVEKADSDKEYDVLLIDKKGFARFSKTIRALNFKIAAFLSEAKNESEIDDSVVMKFFFDELNAESNLSFDMSPFKSKYEWLYVFQVNKKEREMVEKPEELEMNKPEATNESRNELTIVGSDEYEDYETIGTISFDALYEFERPIVADICKHIDLYVKDSLVWYWKLGKYVNKLKNAIEKAGHDFSERMTVLASVLGNKTVRSLYKANQVYDRWNEQEFKRLVALNDKEDKKGLLSFRHLLALSRIDDDSEVEKYALKAVKDGITSRDLEIMLKGKTGKARGAGPKPLVPDSLEGRLLKLHRSMVSFNNVVLAICDDGKLTSDLEEAELDDNLMHVLQNIVQKGHAVVEDLSAILEVADRRVMEA